MTPKGVVAAAVSGRISRRTALGRLAVLGVGTAAASTLVGGV